jgi:hypothetical protein
MAMSKFLCPNCCHFHYFEALSCAHCGQSLGYEPSADAFFTLSPLDGLWRNTARAPRPMQLCVNARAGTCNWLVATGGSEPFCVACRHNRTIPNTSIEGTFERWRRIENAKHRLFHTLIRLGLPLANRNDDEGGLGFDFLYDASGEQHQSPQIVTGHSGGLITINLMEADDVARERMRRDLGEPYRTLLGHFRHETGHYFWERLVGRGGPIEPFRQMFGDERQDYQQALRRHYAEGPPADWPSRFVSAYAASHPWEDFAETFAHYVHMVDALATLRGFDMRIGAYMGGSPAACPVASSGDSLGAGEAAGSAVSFDPYRADTARLIEQWIPFSLALNAVNRSMGQPDLYPFELSANVVGKLDFIGRLIHQAAGHGSAPQTAAPGGRG